MRQVSTRILARTGRVRIPTATRQSFSYKAGRIDNNNHLPSQPSSTEENMSDDNAVLVEDEVVVDVRSFMHGRRNMERRDSVNDVILTERMTYQQRLASWSSSSSSTASSSSFSSSSSSSMTQLIEEIEAMGLGTKRRRHRVYHTKPRQSNASVHVDHTKAQNTGSAGDNDMILLPFAFLITQTTNQTNNQPFHLLIITLAYLPWHWSVR